MPQASAVWSADPAQMWSFPASFMAEFFDNHGMYSLRGRPRWRTVAGGSRSYVAAISAPWRDRVRLARAGAANRAPARRGADRGRWLRERAFRRGRDRHPLRPGAGAARRPQRGRARDPRRDPLPDETKRCSTPTPRCLPRRRAAWSSWNFHLSREPARRTTVTYWMNNLQRLAAERQYLLTLNRTEAIDPARCSVDSSTTIPSTPLRGCGLRRGTPRSAARGRPTTAAPTGAGAFTRTA